MLIIDPSTHYPIEVIDHDSGNKYTITMYYRKGQSNPSLAFDCPDSVRVFNMARNAKKRSEHDEYTTDKG